MELQGLLVGVCKVGYEVDEVAPGVRHLLGEVPRQRLEEPRPQRVHGVHREGQGRRRRWRPGSPLGLEELGGEQLELKWIKRLFENHPRHYRFNFYNTFAQRITQTTICKTMFQAIYYCHLVSEK